MPFETQSETTIVIQLLEIVNKYFMEYKPKEHKFGLFLPHLGKQDSLQNPSAKNPDSKDYHHNKHNIIETCVTKHTSSHSLSQSTQDPQL